MTDQTQSLFATRDVRWMIRRDMPMVVDIERLSFRKPWSEEEFLRVLRNRNCIGMVGAPQENPISFMIYELHKSRIHVLNFAVHPAWRKRGIGRTMAEKLVGKLDINQRTRITLDVADWNLDAQLFFKACDFVAVGVRKDVFDDADAYRMVLRIDGDEQTKESGPGVLKGG